MSLTFKLLSLAVRTVAKPIGNQIKRQAKEHEGFRRFAISQAQRVHRIDMRMRLGILHDAEAQQRMHEREQRAAEEKRKKEEAPTVRTAEEQKKYDERKAKEGQDEKDGKKQSSNKVKIRPLSDARAIELGANFFSEAFIFMVAVGLILLENWRSSRKSSQRRDEVSERLEALEAQIERLHKEHNLPELEALNERIKMAREMKNKNRGSWYNLFSWFRSSDSELDDDDEDEGVPGEVEGTGGLGHAKKQSVAPVELEVKDSKSAEPTEKRNGSPAAPGRVDTVKADSKQR